VLNLDADEVARVLDDYAAAPIPERLRAALRMLERLTQAPAEVDATFIAELREAGLDDADMEEAANVGWHFNFINRAADAFDWPLLDDKANKKTARALQRAGKVLGSEPPSPSFIVAEDGVRRPPELDMGRRHMLTHPGVTSPELRAAAESVGARAFGAERPRLDVPDELAPYLEKVARHAYKICDEDVLALNRAGYDDEAVFELTVCCAMGAACAGVEALFAVLHADAPSPTHA
jgi:alkylhydroperoxidase family enzyme